MGTLERGGNMTTTDLVSVVCETVCRMLPELDSFEVSPNPPPTERYPFENESELWLHVSVGDEWFDLPIDGEVTTDELVEHVASSLQDWVAESTFGWGQLRVPS
jgi:hypothetical protein